MRLVNNHRIMKVTSTGFLGLLFFTVLDSGLCQRSVQNVPATGIGSVRLLQSSSSVSSYLSRRSTLNESEPEVASISSSSSSAADYGHGSVTNSSASSGADAGSVSTNLNFSMSPSSSAAYAVETIFTNSSAGAGDPDLANSSVSTNVSEVAEELIATLEGDRQVTVVGEVLLGELLCDSLMEAEDAPLLQFAISANETLLVNRTSYSAVSGESFTDGVARRTWMGIVTDPEPTEDEALPRGVSMTWGEACDIETFLLEITTHHANGNISLVKSVPCGLPGFEICIVEVALESLPGGNPLTVDLDRTRESTSGRRLNGKRANQGGRTPTGKPSPVVNVGLPSVRGRRKLQSTSVEIQVLVFYSDQALDLMGVSDTQMESMVFAAFAVANVGFADSEIGIDLTIVHQTKLPYEEGNAVTSEKLTFLRENEEALAIRNEYGADLVVLIGELNDVCGQASFLPDTLPEHAEFAYSAASPNCLYTLVLGHEIGHNLGCIHNREDSYRQFEYAHGRRICPDEVQTSVGFSTIMSYQDSMSPCFTSRVNMYSNPNVTYLGMPTGTETENCARAIEVNKVVVSNFRDKILDGQEPEDGEESEEYEGGVLEALWAQVNVWLPFVPIGVVFWLFKRHCRRMTAEIVPTSS